MGTNEGLDRFKTCPSSFFISAEKLIEITILEFMQQLYNEIGSYLDHRIDTPPLDIPSNKQKSLEVDTDYLGASQNQTSLYLQAAPESAISVHSQSSPVPSPTHSESRLSRRHSGASERAQSPSSCVCFRCKNSSRPSSVSSSYDQSLTCACYKCEKAKQKDSSSRHSSVSYSDQQHLAQPPPNMTRRRQSLYRWDDEVNEDPVERFQSPVTSALDEIQQELRYTRPSTFLSKTSSYHSYEDPDDAAEGLDEDIREPLTREGSAQSLLEPVMRIRDTLQQQAIESLDGMSSVADEYNESPPVSQQQHRKFSTNNIPQPNIIPNRLSCLTAYYRSGSPHKALNMHQIKRIPQRRDRMNEYEMGYFDCIQSRTDLNAWLRKQEVKGPPDVMFEFSPPERKPAKRSFFTGKKHKSPAMADPARLTNMKKNKSTLSLASVATADPVHRSSKMQSPTATSPMKGKRWSGLFKGSPFTKKDEKESQPTMQAQAMKRNSFYASPTGSMTSGLDEEGFSKRRGGGHSRQMSEPWHDGYYKHNDSKVNTRRRTSNEEFELASQFDQWQLHERGRTELKTPVEEEPEEEDEIAYFTPDGRLSTSPGKHHSPAFASSDGDNTRPHSHSQISLLSVPSIGHQQQQHHSRRESESSHSRQSLHEHDYMDMEEALDNLSSTFRNIDQDILREILEEADGDYQLAVSSCKKAIFEGRL